MYLENEGKRRRCLFVWCAGAGGDAKAGSVSVTYKGVPPLPDSTMVCYGLPWRRRMRIGIQETFATVPRHGLAQLLPNVLQGKF